MSKTPRIERPSSSAEAEFWILKFLITGEEASLRNISHLASKMKAGLDGDGNIVDPVAHKRFSKGIANVETQLLRLLKQRANKLASSKGINVEEYMKLVGDLDE